MENIDDKKIKATDEKYCSECGEIIKIKAEICPKCGVRQLPIADVIEESTSKNKKLGEKFLFSGGITLGIFLVLIFTTQPQSEWMNGVIGSFMFALVGALIGMSIPSTKKIIYVPTSIAIMFFAALMVGLANN